MPGYGMPQQQGMGPVPVIPAGMAMASASMPYAMGGGPIAVQAYPDALTALAEAKGVFIKQQINLVQVLTGCDMQQRYNGFAWDPARGAVKAEEGKGMEMFFFQEHSDCCNRILCGKYRPFELAITPNSPIIVSTGAAPVGSLTHPDGIVLTRPFKCTICCLNRPVIYMRHNSRGRIATITNPCTLCNYNFDVRAAAAGDGGEGAIAPEVAGENGAMWYRVRGSWLQMANFCFLPCDGCDRVRFTVHEGSDEAYEKPIGEIQRVFPGGCMGMVQAAMTDADNYTLQPPASATPLHKASLMATTILLDFLLYEDTKKDKDNSSSINF